MSKYPEFRRVVRRYDKVHPNNTPSCECCREPAVAVVEVAVSYMRGEDEHFRVCQSHLGDAKSGNVMKLFDDYHRMRAEDGESNG